MSHELKSPITAIKGQLEGMINNIGVYQNRDKYLNRSLAIAEDLDRLVREILVVSKLDTVDFNFKKEKFNLSPILEDIIKNLDYIQIDKKIKTVKKIEKNLIIEGDVSLLKKAFKNIIENGMKYCPENGLFIVEAIKLKDRILIEIFNDGDSILEDDLIDEKIFDAFYRTEKSRNRETGGSGLGLHIVKKILKSHKFSYKIDNKDNGVVFTVEIPIPEKNLEISK
jgi:two-component system sensor histidine kinase VanS